MMWNRENIIGILLLVLCGVVCVIMINAIITGEIPSVPNGMRTPLIVIGLGATAYLLWQRFSGRFRRK